MLADLGMALHRRPVCQNDLLAEHDRAAAGVHGHAILDVGLAADVDGMCRIRPGLQQGEGRHVDQCAKVDFLGVDEIGGGVNETRFSRCDRFYPSGGHCDEASEGYCNAVTVGQTKQFRHHTLSFSFSIDRLLASQRRRLTFAPPITLPGPLPDVVPISIASFPCAFGRPTPMS
jgi:hypothetical protein